MKSRTLIISTICFFLIFITITFIYFSYYSYKEIKTLSPNYTIYKIKPKNKFLRFTDQNHLINSTKEEKPVVIFEERDSIDSILEDLYVSQTQLIQVNVKHTDQKRHKIDNFKPQDNYLIEIGFFDNLLDLEKFQSDFKLKYKDLLQGMKFIIQRQDFSRSFFVLNIGYYNTISAAQSIYKSLSQSDLDCLVKPVLKKEYNKKY